MVRKKSYSTYEAKAHFSEIIRRVRERGETVIVSYHGDPVAEIRPVSQLEGEGLEARIRELQERGVVLLATRRSRLRPVSRRPGALSRFLENREDG